MLLRAALIGSVTLYFATLSAYAWEMNAQRFLGASLLENGETFRFNAIESYFDGRIRHYPPDEEKRDSRLETLVSAGQALKFSKVTLQGVAAAKYAYSTISDSDSSLQGLEIKTNALRIDGFVHAVLSLSGGFDVFAGAQLEYLPQQKETTTSASSSSEKKWSPAVLATPRFGLIKRESWSGGFYASLLSESQRKFSHVASDGTSLESSEDAFLAPLVGGFFEVPLSNARVFGEAVWVRAGETSAATDEGDKIYRDYFRILVSYLTSTRFSDLKLSLSYQTLSYGEQGFIEMDTIPYATLTSDFIFGGGSQMTLGVGLAYGSDGQSLEQFNAKYTLLNYMFHFAMAM